MTNEARTGGRYLSLMMVGHICCDLAQATIPALLPFLVALRGIDYAAAAGLMFATSILSSLVQPLLGILADRKQRPWLMGVGILINGTAIAAVGYLNSYWAIFAVIMLGGFGNALFHPEGARMANCVGGANKGRAMSIFATGGNIGSILGPMLIIFTVSRWGLEGTIAVLPITIAVACVFFISHNKLKALSNAAQLERHTVTAGTARTDNWPAFVRLTVSIFARSIIQSALQTFIPLYWVAVLVQSQETGSLMVTVMALAATAAAYSGGWLGDRFGFRRVIRVAFALMCPLNLLMLLTRNVWLATLLVVVYFALVNLANSPSIVLGQLYLPNRLGLASGVTLGLSVSVGGICSPMLGSVGDRYGLDVALYVVAGIALAGFVSTLFIKNPAPLTAAEEQQRVENEPC